MTYLATLERYLWQRWTEWNRRTRPSKETCWGYGRRRGIRPGWHATGRWAHRWPSQARRWSLMKKCSILDLWYIIYIFINICTYLCTYLYVCQCISFDLFWLYFNIICLILISRITNPKDIFIYNISSICMNAPIKVRFSFIRISWLQGSR